MNPGIITIFQCVPRHIDIVPVTAAQPCNANVPDMVRYIFHTLEIAF